MKDYLATHSWKTTSSGALLIIAAIVHLCFNLNNLTEESVITAATSILGGIGLLVARDNNKSSEDVGAKSPDTTMKGQ